MAPQRQQWEPLACHLGPSTPLFRGTFECRGYLALQQRGDFVASQSAFKEVIRRTLTAHFGSGGQEEFRYTVFFQGTW